MFLALMLAGCEPDPAKTDDTGVVGADDTDPNADDTGTVDDTGSVDDTGTAESSWEALVLPSSSILREEDEGGRLTVDCAFTDEGALADPGDPWGRWAHRRGRPKRSGPTWRRHEGPG